MAQVDIGYPAGLLFGLLKKLATPKEELERGQLLNGIKTISDPHVVQTLSSLPKEAQGEIFRQLFTYQPSPLRRLVKGESNKTLLWPGEEEVKHEAVGEGLGAFPVPYTTKEPVFFTSPPATRERAPSLVQLDTDRATLARKRAEILGVEKPPAERFVQPGTISTKTGQPFGTPPAPRVMPQTPFGRWLKGVHGLDEVDLKPDERAEMEKEFNTQGEEKLRRSEQIKGEVRESFKGEGTTSNKEEGKLKDGQIQAAKIELREAENDTKAKYSSFLNDIKSKAEREKKSPYDKTNVFGHPDYQSFDEWLHRIGGLSHLKRIEKAKSKLHWLLTGEVYKPGTVMAEEKLTTHPSIRETSVKPDFEILEVK